MLIPLKLFPQINLGKFIADTIIVQITTDEVKTNNENINLTVTDQRALYQGRILTIRQTNRWRIIPIDQYIMLKKPFSDLLTEQLALMDVNLSGMLFIKEFNLWYDPYPLFAKGYIINSYVIFQKRNRKTYIIQELRLKQDKKEKPEAFYARLITTWLDSLSYKMKRANFTTNPPPFIYKRNLTIWNEFLIYQDGYAINPHLMLYYPSYGRRKYIRGNAGIFFRHSSKHESIALNGCDQHWFYRLNSDFLFVYNVTIRMGFNRFFRDEVRHVNYYNLFMLNLLTGAYLYYQSEERPFFFLGTGMNLQFNLLPDIIEKIEPAVGILCGINLP